MEMEAPFDGLLTIINVRLSAVWGNTPCKPLFFCARTALAMQRLLEKLHTQCITTECNSANTS